MSHTDHHPIPQSEDAADRGTAPEQVSVSLIGSQQNQQSVDNGYSYNDPEYGGGAENPYRETTESDINIRHIPLGQLVPKPFKTFEQVMIASYVSVIFFFITGLLAVRYARRGKRHQSKGLMGMAQKDLKYAVWCIYASVALGILVFLIIIPVASV
ncbi:hypothetical protein PoB_007186600 [Plakobranchus ocellatus]|uniref:Uncharacterized protein n=1 Tax=Plakobranchus ocellatus TaxID=259542 RepID=A0AAV4DNB3_9GAST|nr:hypothetical protein PoB_007186600 [Plakobranchus ocellatus]